MLAMAFSARYAEDPSVMVFAAGVSNSRETRPEAFERELILLDSVRRNASRMVYFGTCSVEDPAERESPYVRHKCEIEARVLEGGGLVLRLPQVVGRTRNPHTLTNYLAARIAAGDPFELWTRAKRRLVDLDHVEAIGAALIDAGRQGVVNIAPPDPVAVSEIVALLEDALGRTARCVRVEKGAEYAVDCTTAVAIGAPLGIRFEADYARRLIEKYYG